jgi:hypothetical protein
MIALTERYRYEMKYPARNGRVTRRKTGKIGSDPRF